MTTAAQQARATLQSYRVVVAQVVSALRSDEINNAFASFSLEEAVDLRIEQLEGHPDGVYEGRIAAVDRIKSKLDAAIEGIKATDPDSFRPQDEQQDSNTPVTPTTGAATSG